MNYITTSHQLARELFNRPDGFITLTADNKEYLITLKRSRTCANVDDSSNYWTLKGEHESIGNLKI